MSKEQRNKEAIGDFGQTPIYKEVVKTISQMQSAKRKVRVQQRQERIESERTNAELDLIFDDVRAIHPGLTKEQFYYVIAHTYLNELERRIVREGAPPKHGDAFTRGEF
ncbi:MAG: hypothetical protein WA213_21640 [Terriglobales bacterium]